MESVISGPNGLVGISHGFRALMRRVEWRERDAESDGRGWYGAFLQNAGVEGVGGESGDGKAWVWESLTR